MRRLQEEQVERKGKAQLHPAIERRAAMGGLSQDDNSKEHVGKKTNRGKKKTQRCKKKTVGTCKKESRQQGRCESNPETR